MIYKRCSKCGKRIPEGTTCPCIIQMQQRMKKLRDKDYDTNRRDRQSKAFYESKEWKRVRDGVLLLDDYIDVYLYVTTGEIVPADTVHHIIPLKDDWSRRCDVDNLISLSQGSHGIIEGLYKDDKHGTQEKLMEMLRKYRR